MLSKENPYYVLKLNTGETLFAEIIHYDETREPDDSYYLMNPLKLIEDTVDSFGAVEWLPFSDEEIIPVKKNAVFLKNMLSDEYKSFYGSVLMQILLTKIRKDIATKSTSEQSELEIIFESIEKMKAMILALSEKFNFDADLQYEEIEKFEKMVLSKQQQTRTTMH